VTEDHYFPSDLWDGEKIFLPGNPLPQGHTSESWFPWHRPVAKFFFSGNHVLDDPDKIYFSL
jgi:hypothetical protein